MVCLCPLTSLTTVQPWLAVLGYDAASGPVSREGLSHGVERGAQGGVDPLRSGLWVWQALPTACLAQTGKRVPDRKLFLSACLSQRSLPEGYAGAVRTTVSPRALFTDGLGTCLIK